MSRSASLSRRVNLPCRPLLSQTHACEQQFICVLIAPGRANIITAVATEGVVIVLLLTTAVLAAAVFSIAAVTVGVVVTFIVFVANVVVVVV